MRVLQRRDHRVHRANPTLNCRQAGREFRRFVDDSGQIDIGRRIRPFVNPPEVQKALELWKTLSYNWNFFKKQIPPPVPKVPPPMSPCSPVPRAPRGHEPLWRWFFLKRRRDSVILGVLKHISFVNFMCFNKTKCYCHIYCSICDAYSTKF